ncbi:unnamed protein product [Sphagnum tenellum]
MSSLLKKSLAYLGLTLALSAPTLGFCGIWELTHDAISRSRIKTTYPQVVSHLHFLAADETIVADADHEGTVVVAGGHIVISPEAIRSYKNPGDHTKGGAPEFEYLFEPSQPMDSNNKALPHSLEHLASIEKEVSRNGLEGIRISLDILPTHAFFKDPIGAWSYEQFVGELQIALGESLSSVGADVSTLRPRIHLTGAVIDEMNKNPPEIVISTQFNNDKQDCMVTFCGGNILKSEFALERQRARFIHAVSTGKHLYSVGLGASIAKHCQNKMNVQPLTWERASFEGKARPVPVTGTLSLDAELEEYEGHFNGIAMRNLIHNGLFAKAVVVPFPDMKWVCSQVEAGHEAEWIVKYARIITEGVLDYVGKHPEI